MTVREIQRILQSPMVDESVLQEILRDERKGVRAAARSYCRRMEKEGEERLRVEALYEPESGFYGQGLYAVAGVDEVGRGPLAGPVTVAAVILRPHDFFEGLNDSKKVSPARRAVLAKEIKERALATSVVSLSAQEIDSMNIYAATLTAMYRAVKELSLKAEAVIVDAMPLRLAVPVLSLIHGDSKSASVAAASVLAKVHRDRLMEEYEEEYPGYGFGKNKGYGTAEHTEALLRLGVTPIHRRSFEPVKSLVEKSR